MMIGYSSKYSIAVYKIHPTKKQWDLVFMLDDTYREVMDQILFQNMHEWEKDDYIVNCYYGEEEMEDYFDARIELVRR